MYDVFSLKKLFQVSASQTTENIGLDVKESEPSNYNNVLGADVVNDSSFASKPELQTFSTHVVALLYKRYNVAKRDMKGIFCTLVLPIILLVIGLVRFYLGF